MRCLVCDGLDPQCRMYSCEDRARDYFSTLSETEIRKRQDLCNQQLARTHLAMDAERVTLRLQVVDRLLFQEMLKRTD